MDKTLEQLKAELDEARQTMWAMEDVIGVMRKTSDALYCAAYDAYAKKRDEK